MSCPPKNPLFARSPRSATVEVLKVLLRQQHAEMAARLAQERQRCRMLDRRLLAAQEKLDNMEEAVGEASQVRVRDASL